MKNQASSGILRRTLQINAIFSGISGLVMCSSSPMLARLMGIQAPGILIFVGINLVGFATFLGWLSQRQAIPRPFLWGVVASDIAWVFASLIGLSFIPHQLTQIGIFLIVDVAVIVASFAIFQFIFIRRESRVTT